MRKGLKQKNKNSLTSQVNNQSYQQSMNDSQASFQQAMNDLKRQEEADALRTQEQAKDNAIAAESARARGLASTNQAEVATQLQQSLAKPISQTQTQNPLPYNPSGFGSEKPIKAVPGTAAGPTPTETAATMPPAGIAQKINQQSGGTNIATNRFNIPNVEGLQFGGS
jgi:hypothetical protein